MQEIWKDIEGFKGYYQVSNQGRVKSLDRINKRTHNTTRKLKGKIMTLDYRKQNPNYSQVCISLCKHTRYQHFLVSRLVGIAFVPNYKNKPYINHIDSNPSNNVYTNLEWCSHAENMKHAREFGKMYGVRHDDIPIMIQKYLEGTTPKQLGIMYNVSRPTINRTLKIEGIKLRNKQEASDLKRKQKEMVLSII